MYSAKPTSVKLVTIRLTFLSSRRRWVAISFVVKLLKPNRLTVVASLLYIRTLTFPGRKTLRSLLFRVAMPLVAKNTAFKALHEYFTKRPDNPLKKMQSLIAVCNKLIRILFTIGKTQCEFSEERMLRDIPHMVELQIAA